MRVLYQVVMVATAVKQDIEESFLMKIGPAPKPIQLIPK